MSLMHRFVADGTWPITCQDCRRPFGSRAHAAFNSGCTWIIYDARAVEIARTGRPSAWLPRVTLVWDTRGGWAADGPGAMLALVAHHHERGARYRLTEDVWQIVSTLISLAGGDGPAPFDAIFDAARLIVGAPTVEGAASGG